MTTYTLDELRNESRIDSRDLIETWRDLVGGDELNPDPELTAELTRGEIELIEAIRELSEAGIEDWEHGAHLIAEYDFENFAQELAEDIGAIDSNASWPLSYIDWGAAAAALRHDYTSVEFLGTTYFVR